MKDPDSPSGADASADMSPNVESSLGLPGNSAAGLAAVFGPMGGVVFLFAERNSRFVRFWAAQLVLLWASVIALWAILIVLAVVAATIPIVNLIFAVIYMMLMPILGIGFFGVWLFAVIQTFSGRMFRIPFIARYAELLLARIPGA